MTDPSQPLARQNTVQRKAELRRQMLSLRAAMPDKAAANRAIFEHCLGLIRTCRPRLPLVYVSSAREVDTWPLLDDLLSAGGVAVPYCIEDRLGLFRLQSHEELAPGKFGILEPHHDLRLPEREVAPQQIDLALVPGVAFDRHGGRLGYGRGYFDRLMVHLPAATPRVGLGFECQVLPGTPLGPGTQMSTIPTEPHDIPLTHLVTERGVFQCLPHQGPPGHAAPAT